MNFAFLTDDGLVVQNRPNASGPSIPATDRFNNNTSDGLTRSQTNFLRSFGNDAGDLRLNDLPARDRTFIQDLQNSDLSDYEKIALIQDHVQTRLQYHRPTNPDGSIAPENGNLNSTISNGLGDCEDYAQMTYAYARLAGIPEDRLGIAVGTGSNGQINFGGHATLIYQDAGGQTYIIDNFFSDPIPINGPGATGSVVNNQFQMRDDSNPDNTDWRTITQPGAQFSMIIDGIYSNGTVYSVYGSAVSQEESSSPAPTTESPGPVSGTTGTIGPRMGS